MKKNKIISLVLLLFLVFALMPVAPPAGAEEEQKTTAQAIAQELALPADGYTALMQWGKEVMSWPGRSYNFVDTDSQEWLQNGAIVHNEFRITSRHFESSDKYTFGYAFPDICFLEYGSVAEAKKAFENNFDVSFINKENSESKERAQQRLNEFLDNFYEGGGRKNPNSERVGFWRKDKDYSQCYPPRDQPSRPAVGNEPPVKRLCIDANFGRYNPTTSINYYSVTTESFCYQYFTCSLVRTEAEKYKCEDKKDKEITETGEIFLRDHWVKPGDAVPVSGSFDCEYHFYRIANCVVCVQWFLLYTIGERNAYTDEWPEIRSTLERMAKLPHIESADIEKPTVVIIRAQKEGHLPAKQGLGFTLTNAAVIKALGNVLDQEGIAVADARVFSPDAPGVETTSGIDGFYELDIAGTGAGEIPVSTDLVLRKVGLQITGEPGSDGMTVFSGVVADGVSTLTLNVKACGILANTVTVKPPDLGEIKSKHPLGFLLVLNSKGEGTLEYVPPAYLNADKLSRELAIPDETGTRRAWAAVATLEFAYEDERGQPGNQTFEIQVCRPPVMVVHGFTGNETTWEKLAAYLRPLKFDPVVREYYKGPVEDSTIEVQSGKLGNNIKDERARYAGHGVKLTRVDVVGHSMGGLITRNYISVMPRLGKRFGEIQNDIRKLIMVGTPNHGATSADELLGKLSAAYGSKYHQLAASQLYEGDVFFTTLNAGERFGRHLDPQVEYACLIGRRKISLRYDPVVSLTESPSGLGVIKNILKAGDLASDDGVVRVTSAELNGVMSYRFPPGPGTGKGFIHSPAGLLQTAFPGNSAITVAPEVFTKVSELLQSRIMRVPLNRATVEVRLAEGAVSLRQCYTHGWSALSTPVTPGGAQSLDAQWNQFKTGEGRVTLGFRIEGKRWGTLHLEPQTELSVNHASPDLVEVLLKRGKARFYSRSRKGANGHFSVVMGDGTGPWYRFNPKARVMDMGTDFVVESGDETYVYVMDGKVLAAQGLTTSEDDALVVERGQGAKLAADSWLVTATMPSDPWWADQPVELDSSDALGFREFWAALCAEMKDWSHADWRVPLLQLYAPAWKIIAGAAMLIGLIVAAFGYRLHRMILALAGGCLGAAAAVALADHIPGSGPRVVAVAGATGAAVGAALMFVLSSVVIFMLGAGSAGLALQILAAQFHVGYPWWGAALAGLIGGVVAVRWPRALLAVISSAAGVAIAGCALPVLIGWIKPTDLIWQGTDSEALGRMPAIWVWLIAAVATIGMVILQLRTTPKRKRKAHAHRGGQDDAGDDHDHDDDDGDDGDDGD